MTAKRYKVEEDFCAWFDFIEQFEKNQAIKKINAGENIDQVLEQYSHAINRALLHAVFINIKKAMIRPYDADLCRKQYQSNTPDNYKNVADHILE
jgi:transcriptional regulator of met regulon